MIRAETNNSGVVRFVNCAFWSPCNLIATIAGRGTVGFSDCTFAEWDRNKEGRRALQAEAGTLLENGCQFREVKLQIELGGQVRRAVISGNVFTRKPRLTKHGEHSVVFSNNASD